MKYVTVAMIAEHADRHHETVLRALKATQTPVVKKLGVRGMRVDLRDANKFLALQWPEAGPMRIEEVASR